MTPANLDQLTAAMLTHWPQMDESQIVRFFEVFKVVDIDIMLLALAECRNTLRFRPVYRDIEAVLQKLFRPHYEVWRASQKTATREVIRRDPCHADIIRRDSPALEGKPDSYVLLAYHRHLAKQEAARQKITLAQAHKDLHGFSRLLGQCVAELTTHGYDYDNAKSAADLIMADDESLHQFAERLIQNDLPRNSTAIECLT